MCTALILAVATTCLLIGVWYVIGFSCFALAAPRETIEALAADKSANPITPLAADVWGRFDVLVIVTGMTAAIGALVPCSTAASRVLFAMGRDGTLPRWLGAVHPRYKAPWNALHIVFLATALGVMPVALIVGATPTINWWSNVFAWYIAIICICANVSNVVYNRRFLRDRFSLSWNLFVPVIGIGAQLLVIWQLVIKELWNQGRFGRSAQLFIIAVAAATALYAHSRRRRRPTSGD